MPVEHASDVHLSKSNKFRLVTLSFVTDVRLLQGHKITIFTVTEVFQKIFRERFIPIRPTLNNSLYFSRKFGLRYSYTVSELSNFDSIPLVFF